MSFRNTLVPPLVDTAVMGAFVAPAANPTLSFKRSANATAYVAGQLVGPATLPYPSFQLQRVAGAPVIIRRLRWYCSLTTGLVGVVMNCRLWSGPMSYTGGDGSTYAVSKGGANAIATFQGTWVQDGDYASCEMTTLVGYEVTYVGAALNIFPDLQTKTAYTPSSGDLFTCIAEVWQG